MASTDENQEEVSFKVADRRKFNADGTLREGVTIEPPKAKPEPEEKTEAPETAAESASDVSDETVNDDPDAGTDAMAADDADLEEMPGARDPASFVNFLSMLATNAATALGAVPNPATGQRSLDLETGKYWLDTIGMIRDKVKGNLHPKESRLLDGLLGDLRMQYVQLVKATEEKSKAQAAQQFSGADILGKK